MKNIVILGAGELGKEVVWLIEDINRIRPTWLILGFLDDTKEPGEICHGYPVLGGMGELEILWERNPFSAVIALQNGVDRGRIAGAHEGFTQWTSVIHPTAVLAPDVTLGNGSIVFPQVTVSVGSELGQHNLLYIHATICNDCRFGECVSVMTGVTVSEHVTIGRESYIAAGSNIYPHVTLGQNVRVAVGTTVSEDVSDASEIGKKGKGLFFK